MRRGDGNIQNDIEAKRERERESGREREVEGGRERAGGQSGDRKDIPTAISSTPLDRVIDGNRPLRERDSNRPLGERVR